MQLVVRDHLAMVVAPVERDVERERQEPHPESRKLWERACAEFHARFDELAFPGGYETAGARILAGDPNAIEAALCFLELRPYFFRSGYMHRSLLRKAKRALLDSQQSARLRTILERQAQWQAQRKVGRAG
jgi:hypothetical protein